MIFDISILSQIDEVYYYSSSGEFKKAYLLSKKILKNNSKNFIANHCFAEKLAESSFYEQFEVKNKNTNINKAILIFKELLKIKKIPRSIRKDIQNEIYFFSGQYLKQIALGQRTLKTGNYEGHFSVGVGSLHQAIKYHSKNQSKKTMEWANRSIKAWKKFLEYENYYQYCFICLAISYYLVGDIKNGDLYSKKAKSYLKKCQYLQFQVRFFRKKSTAILTCKNI